MEIISEVNVDNTHQTRLRQMYRITTPAILEGYGALWNRVDEDPHYTWRAAHSSR